MEQAEVCESPSHSVSAPAVRAYRGSAKKPRTKKRRVSVIIPVRNEERTIAAVLDALRTEAVDEVIVVDGASEDRTVDIARSHGVRVIGSTPGRGRQMNAGAGVATGDLLVFLHADTMPPRGFVRSIQHVLAQPGTSAGAFRLRINATGASFRLIERFVQWRSRVRQTPYGDQAMFLTKDTFDRVGGFPDWSLMEDVDLVARLRRLGQIRIAPYFVNTSARRWLERGVWRTALINQLCLAAFRMRIPTEWIARWRERGLSARSNGRLQR